MARRKAGTGTIKLKNGTFFIGFRPTPGANQIWERVGRRDEGVTRRDAEELLEQRRVEARNGQIAKTRHLLRDVADQWREERKFANLAPKTRESEDTALYAHLLPAFGDDRLSHISPALLRQYITRKLSYPPGHPKALPVAGKKAGVRDKPLGTTAVKQQLQTLSKIYEWAIDRGMAISNPCSRVEKTDLRVSPSEIEVFEIEEVRKLIRFAANEEERTMFLLLAGCGLRIGELFGLKIEDYDRKSKVLHVQRTIRRDGGRTVLADKPKTAAGNRFLVLDPPIAVAVEQQINRVEDQGRTIDGLLFPNSQGKVRSAENFRRRCWRKALERAGLPTSRGPHTMRHTFASELIEAGKSDTDIASKMGHKNAHITRLIYAKAFERTKATQAGVVGLYLDS